MSDADTELVRTSVGMVRIAEQELLRFSTHQIALISGCQTKE